MSGVDCDGHETSLFQCSHSIGSAECDDNRVAGVICQGNPTITMISFSYPVAVFIDVI